MINKDTSAPFLARCRVAIDDERAVKIINIMNQDVIEQANKMFNNRKHRICSAFLQCSIEGNYLIGDIHVLPNVDCKPFETKKIKSAATFVMRKVAKEVTEFYMPHFQYIFKHRIGCSMCNTRNLAEEWRWGYTFEQSKLTVTSVMCPKCGSKQKLNLVFPEQKYKCIAAYYPSIMKALP